MEEDLKRLKNALAKLRSRRIAVRWVLLSGRALLFLSFLLLFVVVVRRTFLLATGEDPLGIGVVSLVLTAAGLIFLTPVLVRLALLFSRPSLAAVARDVDRRTDSHDLLAAGLSAARSREGLAPAVLSRAAKEVHTVAPERLFPARRSIAKLLAVLPLALAAVWLLGVAGGEGVLPSGIAGESDSGSAPASMAGAPQPGSDTPEPEQAGPDAKDPDAKDPDEEDRRGGVLVRVVPARKVFAPDEPVVLFITLDGDEELEEPVELALGLVLDGVGADLGRTVKIEPGPDGGELLSIDARMVPGLAEKLTPGDHRVGAVAAGGGRGFGSELAEFRIEGDADGGEEKGPDENGGNPPPEPRPEPEPEPEPGGAPRPPPEVEEVPRFVAPLTREGETQEKKGFALVPDPEAPPGTAPDRLPIDRAAREAANRAESAVPTERLSDEDRKTVSRYFDLLREGR